MSSIREEAAVITELAFECITTAGERGVTVDDIRNYLGANLTAAPGTYRNKDTILDFALDAFEHDGEVTVQPDTVSSNRRKYYPKH